ncbi:N-6 DNA methylase [Pseudomonas aeruginosa]|uniref:N-6 DNA methylase n=1 Tax=Pseudomonas aeruginosa TaxID=287 RepID=UPI001375D788|nr:N-6 DNA methylase [Pseudomonas aeruginosa]MDU0606251.1 N-6 DNA methylase [Pseudomonas aeruginosa]HDQ4554784.1 N-6 DNA methylase [Pseudomonas aeruginosa]
MHFLFTCFALSGTIARNIDCVVRIAVFVEQATVSTETSQRHSAVRKKSLGAFYTPSYLSRILCEWSIRSVGEVVLEPSFGGCTFLEEIALRFQRLGSSRPLSTVRGCDIDDHAFDKLRSLPYEYDFKDFVLEDFLSLDAQFLGSDRADAVIGNPPYIGHSQVSKEQKRVVLSWKDRYKIRIDARSSLWAYFFVHSLGFIKDGGRLAFVLPGSFLSADYSRDIHALLSQHFEKALVISLAERIFVEEGAEERTVILLAEGFSRAPCSSGDIRFAHATLLSNVMSTVNRWMVNAASLDIFDSFGVGSFVEREVIDSFLKARKALPCVTLGELSTVSIGIVTGDTKFFIRKKTEWQSSGVESKYLKFVVPKIKCIKGVNLTRRQVAGLIKSDERCLLINTEVKKLSPQVLLYLSSYPRDKIDIATYRKRAIWHQPDDGKIPGGFLSFLTHNGPRLVINSAGVNCTNSVHRVFFSPSIDPIMQKALAISMLSTFSQLHAEIIGRPCGSGALKLEPKDAMSLALILPDNLDPDLVEMVFDRVNSLLLVSDFDDDAVREVSDSFLALALGEGFSEYFRIFDSSLAKARAYRKGDL